MLADSIFRQWLSNKLLLLIVFLAFFSNIWEINPVNLKGALGETLMAVYDIRNIAARLQQGNIFPALRTCKLVVHFDQVKRSAAIKLSCTDLFSGFREDY